MVTHPTVCSAPLRKAKKPTRRTSKYLLKETAEMGRVKRKRNNAHKQATTLYAKEREETERARTDKKRKRGKTAREEKFTVE